MKENNIPYFGNCLRAPDSELEMYTFNAIHKEANQGMEKRKEGSCKYLMKLESEWENYEIGQSFLSFPDDAKGQQSGITMTSMLFCKHGGFIYPVTSGQVKVEEEVEEEIVEEVEVEEVLVLMEPELDDSEAIKEYVWNFFLNKGFSKEAVAGIVGNVQQECSFNLITAAALNSSRFGLFQWSTNPTNARKIKFDKWVTEEKLDINLVSTQCEYAYVEMTTGGMLKIVLDENDNNPSELLCSYDTFIRTDTPEEAAKIFAASFEGCSTGHYTENGQMHYYDIQESAARQAYARRIYDEKTNE